MPFIEDINELHKLYLETKNESDAWREDYHEFERLADNDLIDDLDPSLPEVNDGTLAASLYKLPKRIVSTNLKGRVKSLDRDEAWVTELANLQWENVIIPNANSQAPFYRKWKDAVRKAAIYGSVPIITLFVERGDYTGADFIVAQPQDVKLEPGKVSDNDSDVIFWDVYYTKQQVLGLIETAKEEQAQSEESDNKENVSEWDIEALESIAKADLQEERENREDYKNTGKDTRRKGIKFCIAFQRGVGAPFYMYHKATKKAVRTWTNQDPTGDIPVHFLYCYQDMHNPYGVGIVKLAGGTQNALDYFRQADILATQLGLRPPISISGDTGETDLDSIVYEQDAQWMIGNASVNRQELSNQVYSQLPNRISQYKISLNQLIPTGDTSIAAGSGDQDYSKTPAGVKFQQSQLSIDDEDFKDNFFITFELVAKSMINIQFANMQGTDLMKLSNDERDLLTQAGLEFPLGEEGEPSNELEVIWDEARSKFDFEIDAEQDKTQDEQKRLEALLKVVELRASDPSLEQALMMSGKKLNIGELFASIIQLTTDNDKVLEDVTPEDMQGMEQQQQEMAMQEQMAMQGGGPQGEMPQEGMPQGGMPEQPMPQGEMPQELPNKPQMDEGEDREQFATNIEAIMEEHGVDEEIAAAMLNMEQQGFSLEEVLEVVATYLEEPEEEQSMEGLNV